MYKAIRCWVFVVIASILLTGSLTMAEDKTKGGGDKLPGWEKREKKGWEGDVPPGIEKKGDWLPPGLSKGEQSGKKKSRPPGWSHGKKEGWKGADMLPGLQKKEKGEGEKE